MRKLRTDRALQQRVSNVLVQAGRGQTPDLAGSEEFSRALVAAARYHRVAPLLHVAGRDSAPAVVAPLRTDRDMAVAVHLRATILLAQLGAALGDIPWVTFKGAVLSETAHPVPGLRTYRDVDVLVDPRDLREVTARLLEMGWVIADYDDMLRNPHTPGEMHWTSPSGLLVDLHWAMVNTAVRRRRFAIPTADLLARRAELRLGLDQAWTLGREDAVVHVCLHAALTGANRLLLLVDADGLARSVEDWRAVARRAVEWRAQAHVALVLSRARRVLGTPVPADLHRLLGLSGAFAGLTGAVDRVAPVAQARAEPGVARLVARAVQPGAARTVAAVAGSAGRRLRETVGRDRSARDGRTRADESALQTYLAAVESAATSG